MEKIIVADSSCLIVLEKIGALELLKQTFNQIFITPEVQQEFGIALPDWIIVQNIADKNCFEALCLKLIFVGL